MDWKGVAVTLQKAAKDYELYRDAAVAAEKIVDLERAESALRANISAMVTQRDAIVQAANERAEEWNIKEKDLVMSFDSARLKYTTELDRLKAAETVARDKLALTQQELQAFLATSTKEREALVQARTKEEADYAARIAKVKKQLEDAKAAVAKV